MADLRLVVQDIAEVLNNHDEIHVVSLLGLDGPGEEGTAGGADHDHVYHDVPSGSGSGPYQLGDTPVSGSETVYVNGLRQRRVASSPGLNEYYMSDVDEVTFGYDAGSEYICVDYKIDSAVTHTHVINESISETGTTVHLAATPASGSEVLFFNLVRLRRLPSGSPGINEYTISGDAITLASPGRQSGDYMTADYLT